MADPRFRMLKLTKKADYGLIALKHLAVKDGSASAKDIADTYGIPLPLLSKVLQKLARGGFLLSEHGTNGGYRLARKANLITALEVIRSIDGPIFLTSCFTGQDRATSRSAAPCGTAAERSRRHPESAWRTSASRIWRRTKRKILRLVPASRPTRLATRL